MKLIQELSESIEEEISDAKKYVEKALEVKELYPELSDTYYSLSRAEGDHMLKLHDQVTKLIRDYRNKNGEPPSDMLAVYEYLHKKHISDYADVKRLQEIYSGR